MELGVHHGHGLGRRGLENALHREAGVGHRIEHLLEGAPVCLDGGTRVAESPPVGAEAFELGVTRAGVVLGLHELVVAHGMRVRVHEVPAGPEHAEELAEDAVPVFDVVEHQWGEHEIERCVLGEGERLGEVGDVKLGTLTDALSGDLNHRGSDVGSDNFGALLQEDFGVQAGAASSVEDSLALHIRQHRERRGALVQRVVWLDLGVLRVAACELLVVPLSDWLLGHGGSLTREAWIHRAPSHRLVDMCASMLRSLRDVTLILAPCSALALGGCFVDPPVPGTSETTGDGTTGAGETSSTGRSGSGSGLTEPDPSVSTSTSTSTSTGPEPTRGSTGQTTVAGSTSEGESAGATSGSVVVCEPFSDEFEGREADDAWSYTQFGNTGVDGGEMVMTVTPEIEAVNVNKMEIPGGWTGEGVTVTVELGQVSDASVNQMIRFTSTDNVPDLVSFRVQGQPAGSLLQVWHATNNADFEEPISVPFNPLQHRWLRVREADDALLFETSPDGIDFSEFFELDDSFDLSGAAVGIAVTNFLVLDESETVSFASFELTCPE